jgi:hypothetical protein
MRILLALLAISLMSAAQAQKCTARSGDKTAVLVELYTSEGCNSCPPADRWLSGLGKKYPPELVVPLALHVDYWDYIGWKDTLAKPRHTVRQRFYARTRGDGDVYTPQVVINGVSHAVGNDKAAIEHAIAESRRESATLSLPVKVAVADGKITVTIAAGADKASGEVWLCALGTHVPVAIARGENSGQTVTYHNVVRRWVKLGDFTGAARTFSVPVTDLESADAAAVIVQAGTVDRPGAMLGAALAGVR